ncbi:MAG: hypothetical protein WCR08_10430, partial [Gammaproteobacteria bacterium]
MKFSSNSSRHRWSGNSLRVAIAGAILSGSMIVVANSSGAATKSKGTLTVASAGFPSTFDPAINGGDYNGRGAFTSLAYDPLFVRTADGSHVAGLATKGDFGPQNKSLKITLRSGVGVEIHFALLSLVQSCQD